MRKLNKLEKDLHAYLLSALGLTVELSVWPQGASLPLYLREAYDFARTDILGRACLLAIARGESRESPGRIAKHIEAMGWIWEGEIILVAPRMGSVDRARLVAARVSFVVPGKQLYLPPLGVDFRELFPKPLLLPSRLGPAAQLVVLYAIERGLREMPSPTLLAKELGYSKMTLGRAYDEIEAAGLAERSQEGKARGLVFLLSGRALWESALPRLGDPVRRRAYAPAALIARRELLVSGLSALSECSNLAAPARPAYAAYLAKGADDPFAGAALDHPDEDAAEIEYWSYDPCLLAEGRSVDPLSLALSLRGEGDERVSKAIDELLETLRW